jgi:hypothetical protein
MKKKVLIFDTSVLCVWLKVPSKETCGPEGNQLTFDIVDAKIEDEKKLGTTFVLPIASIIETGNHIAHSTGDRHAVGHAFADIISATADQISPWAAFTEQSDLSKQETLKVLADRWKESVISGQSLGDASIVDVANYYASAGFEVEIFTGDEGLKAYEPTTVVVKPRRRR